MSRKHPSGGEVEDADHDGIFVCERARKGGTQQVSPTVAVVDTRFQRETGHFGFAWLTEDGELGTGTDDALELRDSLVQAMCKAAIDLLGGGKLNVRLVCWGPRAVALVRHVLDTGSVPDSPAFPLSERTRALLAEVIVHRQRISVHAETCQQLHRGAAEAERLAALALSEERGLETSPQVQNEAGEISQQLSDSTEPPLLGPDAESDHAWWLTSRPGGGQLVWQTALYRMHLDGGWCALPEGELPGKWDQRQRLRLRVEHHDGGRPGPLPAQEVTLRRRGGQWELSGIHWPEGLLPGVLVTFERPQGTMLLTASTTLLPTPERFDDLELRHRYDPQVVTRENAPGSDQDREVPDLSDVSWVLRALRTLGYLSVDGTATLAEEALVRNCLRLGMPRSRADRIGRAVEQLLRSGRIERVSGSLDQHGRPWHPARAGQLPAELLRYVPVVEAIDPSLRRGAEEAGLAQRSGHWVNGFVRRLPPGAQASADQIDLHREAVLNAEVVDQSLPEGYTFVHRHRRGR
ncbi:hypothetical protein [Micromonospora sp. IBHARD004]|uniref:hypothetical protein n=1 Tax=Micromonospora sp. IBHARD004 TaxID=3457764 RepID=UPI0040582FCB